jgi:hypothetical protein
MHLIGGAIAAAAVLAAVPAASAAMHARGTPDCLRGQLIVRSNGFEGTAGTVHGAWVFTDRSATSCRLFGYPDLQQYGKGGRPIATTVDPSLPPGPAEVILAPGGSATFLTSYSDIVSGSDRCPAAAVLQITPPGAAASLFIPAELHACDGTIRVSAVEAGIHHA